MSSYGLHLPKNEWFMCGPFVQVLKFEIHLVAVVLLGGYQHWWWVKSQLVMQKIRSNL